MDKKKDIDDAKFYLAATKELDSARLNEQIWSKAIAITDGDAEKARYAYIRYRAEQFRRVSQEMNKASSVNEIRKAASGIREFIKSGTQNKRERHPIDQKENLAYGGTIDRQLPPKELLERWNWGAALAPFVWGLFYCPGWQPVVYLLSTVILPGITQIVGGIIFGVNGNKWAWQSKQWESTKQFIEVQRKWAVAAGILVPLSYLAILSNF